MRFLKGERFVTPITLLRKEPQLVLMLSLPFMDIIIPTQSFLEPAIIWACPLPQTTQTTFQSKSSGLSEVYLVSVRVPRVVSLHVDGAFKDTSSNLSPTPDKAGELRL